MRRYRILDKWAVWYCGSIPDSVMSKTFYAKDIQKEAKQKEYMENLKAYHEKHPDEDFSDVMEGKKKRYPDPKGPTRS